MLVCVQVKHAPCLFPVCWLVTPMHALCSASVGVHLEHRMEPLKFSAHKCRGMMKLVFVMHTHKLACIFHRWKEALDAGKAPPVVLESCDEAALRVVSLDQLKQHALQKA